MRVQVRFFSIFRERTGHREARLDLPEGATVDQALATLARTYPALGDTLGRDPGMVLVSLNRAYASRTQTVREGDEIGVFPPVSGGAEPAPKGMLLLSGGFDSPVAGRLIQEHGYDLDAVHFSFQPFTDDASERKAAALAAHLGIPRLAIVPLGPPLAEVAKTCEHRYYFVLQKRMMLRVADALADRWGATVLVTGENLGQVSSQTLDNLTAIDAGARHPVLRPLLGWDKQEIIAQARRIGTYETSCGPEVCDVLGPRYPSTRSTLPRILEEETKVDVAGLAAAALDAARTIDPRAEADLTAAAGPARAC